VAIATDSEVDRELAGMKSKLEELKRSHMTLANTFQAMPPKEKARLILFIENTLKEITGFLGRMKTKEIYNSGTKFSIENLKQNLNSFTALWKKTLKTLEQGGAAPASRAAGTNLSQDAQPRSLSNPDPIQNATQAYNQILSKHGRALNDQQRQEFENKIKGAYVQAQSQYGGKKINIEIIEEAGKVKVKMKPS